MLHANPLPAAFLQQAYSAAAHVASSQDVEGNEAGHLAPTLTVVGLGKLDYGQRTNLWKWTQARFLRVRNSTINQGQPTLVPGTTTTLNSILFMFCHGYCETLSIIFKAV